MPLHKDAFNNIPRAEPNPYVRELNRLQDQIVVRDEYIRALEEALEEIEHTLSRCDEGPALDAREEASKALGRA